MRKQAQSNLPKFSQLANGRKLVGVGEPLWVSTVTLTFKKKKQLRKLNPDTVLLIWKKGGIHFMARTS